MSQAGTTSISLQPGIVFSITATAPLTANGVSGTPESGAVTLALTTPLTVPFGGTGDSSFTAYAPIVGGTTSTGALQSATTGFSNSGYVLTSNGASALPSWQAASTGSLTYTDEATNFNAAVNNGYFVSAAATVTLPASPAQGNVIDIVVDTTGSVVINANTGQVIRVGSIVSSSAGSATNTARGDRLYLIFRNSDSTWICQSMGNWTLA